MGEITGTMNVVLREGQDGLSFTAAPQPLVITVNGKTVTIDRETSEVTYDGFNNRQEKLDAVWAVIASMFN